MIADRIRESISSGTVIPKPEAKADFVVKAWGKRRGEDALIYCIPNHGNPSKPHEKGVTESEFEKAFAELQKSGEFTRAWFNKHLPNCAKEGACNTTQRLAASSSFSARQRIQVVASRAPPVERAI